MFCFCAVVSVTYSREVLKVGSINYVRKIFGSILRLFLYLLNITFGVPTFLKIIIIMLAGKYDAKNNYNTTTVGQLTSNTLYYYALVMVIENVILIIIFILVVHFWLFHGVPCAWFGIKHLFTHPSCVMSEYLFCPRQVISARHGSITTLSPAVYTLPSNRQPAETVSFTTTTIIHIIVIIITILITLISIMVVFVIVIISVPLF